MPRYLVTASFVLAAVALAGASASPTLGATRSDCQHRDNGTERRLLQCIQAAPLWEHLQDLQKIADENPGAKGHGNRNTGTPGYLASVNYVANLMEQAGYRVQIQSYQWRQSRIIGAPTFSIDGHSFASAKDWFVASLSGSGKVRAEIAVPGQDDQDKANGTGCESTAFKGFHRGYVALLRRGSCDFDRQVANAEHAGAAAIIFYNDNPSLVANAYRKNSDGNAFPMQLSQEAHIPVIGALSYSSGELLATEYRSAKAPVADISVRTETKSNTDYNVVADSPFGDPEHTIVVDAHLDAIYGAGILDNGSGSGDRTKSRQHTDKKPASVHLVRR